MEWYLEEDPGGNQIPLTRGITTVGRTAKCTLQLDSSYCSRAHCNIELDEAGNVKISDFSTNGTFVNGKCYINMDINIADGDRIGIGCWPFDTVSGTDKLPVYYIRKKQEIESSHQQPDEQDNVSKNDKEVICISDDEDDDLDLQKYACEDQSKQTKEVVVKVETNMDVDEYIEPPEFLPAASTSKTSAFVSPPANQMVGVFATSELQFLPSKTPSVLRSNGQNNSSLSESDQDQIPNQLHSKQTSRLLSFEDVPVSTTAVAQNFINDDVEDMDVDTALSQSILDIKQEIADLDYEESFEMKAEVVAQGLPKSAESAEQMSSPIYLIGDDDEDDEEEELFSIWTQKLSQSFSSTKTTDYDHEEYVSESKLEHMDIDDLSQQMRRSLSLDDDLSDLREKKKVNDEDAKKYKPETRSSKKDAEYKQKESDTKSKMSGLSKSIDLVDKSETKAGSKHKLDIYDAGPSTSRGSGSGKDNDFIHFEPKRKRPEVIDAPSLPTGKGKLRGLSAANKSSSRSDLERKLQNVRATNQEKLMKDKWRQKPSLERQEEKARLKDIHEARKMKLKEMAREQAQKRKSEPEDYKVVKKPKVKVTERNRGSYLAADFEAANSDVLSKKTPRLRSRDSSDSLVGKESSSSSDNKSPTDSAKKNQERRKSTCTTADDSINQMKNQKDTRKKMAEKEEELRHSHRRSNSENQLPSDTKAKPPKQTGKLNVLSIKIPRLRLRESTDSMTGKEGGSSGGNKSPDEGTKQSLDRRRSSCSTPDEGINDSKNRKDTNKKAKQSISEEVQQSPLDTKKKPSEQEANKRKSILRTPKSISLRNRKSSVRFANDDEVRYFEIDPNNNLGRKVDCKDAPMSSAVIEQIQKRAQGFIPAVDFSEEIINVLLGWDPNWLGTDKNEVNGRNHALMPMVQQYRNFDDFTNIVIPLFKLELWHSIQKDFERKPKDSYCVFKVTQFVTTSKAKYMRYVLHCEANSKAIKDKSEFTTQQLCIVNLGNLQIFGIITFVRFSVLNATQEMININVELRENARNKNLLEKSTTVKIKPISNVRVECGIYNAINNLRYSPLGKCILNPFELIQNSRPNVQNIKYTGYNELNSNQRAILLEAYLRCIDSKKTNNLFLIEGPPGTGKSRIITNLALQTLYGEEVRKLERKKRILICAQSNAAVDIIALKLLEIRGKMDRDKFNLVRFGVYDRIHEAVRCISLQALVQSTLRDRHTEANREILKNERKLLESQIEKLGKYASANNVSRDELQKKKDRLVMINQLLGVNISTAGMERAYPRFLAGAHIVCTTLSSSIKLLNYVKKFDVCIIDEATQCAEPYTLLPLQFGISSLILVGDTQQLPATVLSSEANDREFGRSLFTRIQKCLEGQKNCPIQLLKTQYRMHPEICLWSNSYFYNNVLINNEATKRFPNLVKPYAVLSLEYTQGGNLERGQLINVQEAKFVVALLLRLVKLMPPDHFSYGIITPYSHHKDYLQKQIIEAGIKKVIVNTIDSYQGKEKDVVIISCVRTSGIGFLGNSQRLNVALTRAKKCLYLCGNFNSLQREHAWKSLLSNAKNRQLFYHFKPNDVIKFDANVMRYLAIPSTSNAETKTSS